MNRPRRFDWKLSPERVQKESRMEGALWEEMNGTPLFYPGSGQNPVIEFPGDAVFKAVLVETIR